MKIAQLARLAVPAFVAVGLFAVAPASAQTAAPAAAPKPLTIGVVDTNQVIEQSLAGKAVMLERDRYAATYSATVKDTDGKLRAEDQELSQQRGVLAPDVYQQRATAFQQKITDFQNTVRDKQERLEFATNQASQEIANTMLVVAQEVAKERGLNAVMARQTLLVFDPSMDITKSVLDKLNARLPTVAFQNPETLQRSDGAQGAVTGGAGAKAAPGAAPAAAKKK